MSRPADRRAAGEFEFPPLSPSTQAIIEAGGLIPMLKRKLAAQAEAG